MLEIIKIINLEINVGDVLWFEEFSENVIDNLQKDIYKMLNFIPRGDKCWDIFAYEDVILPKFSDNKAVISILLSNDKRMCEINKDYRGKDNPTNVISFAAIDDDFLGQVPDDNLALGDIIVSLETIIKEALEQNKDKYNHLLHIIFHGVLHLLGYDHIEDGDAEDMEKIEIDCLEKLNIVNPYLYSI